MLEILKMGHYGKSGAQLIHAHITRSASITHPMWAEQNKSRARLVAEMRFAAAPAAFPAVRCR